MCKVIIDGETVEFEGSVLIQGDLAPYKKTARHIIICDSVTEIGYYVFGAFCLMDKIEIPNSVNTIGACAFYECGSLENISIPDSVTSIGSFAFCRNKSLKSINIPKSVKRIGAKVFYGCDNIRIETKVTKSVLSRMVVGRSGEMVTICIGKNEYPILTDQRGNTMVITGYVDHAGGKLYSGYKFNGSLTPQNKELVYCYCIENRCLTGCSLNEVKEKVAKSIIR